jgi:hypothetical protein
MLQKASKMGKMLEEKRRNETKITKNRKTRRKRRFIDKIGKNYHFY